MIESIREVNRDEFNVMFKVDFDLGTFKKLDCGEMRSLYGEWSKTEPVAGEIVVVSRLDLSAVFRFDIEPYSMEANRFYVHLDAFGKWLDTRLGTKPGTTPATKPAGEPMPRVKSLISRVTAAQSAV